MWSIDFVCSKCSKKVTIPVNPPSCMTIGNTGNRAIRTFITEFALPPEAQFHSAYNNMCYDCGRASWDVDYPAAQARRAAEFESLVAEYLAILSDKAALQAKLAAADAHSRYQKAYHVEALTEATLRAAA